MGGGNICFFRYAFLVLGVSFVGNATPSLYFLTFSGSIQAQNLCKSLAGVRCFRACGACMRKFCTKEKSPIPLEKAEWGIVSYFFLSPLYTRKATITTARAKMM